MYIQPLMQRLPAATALADFVHPLIINRRFAVRNDITCLIKALMTSLE
jgi:hypothetical protein